MSIHEDDIKIVTERDGIGKINPTRPLVAKPEGFHFNRKGSAFHIVSKPLSYNSLLDLHKIAYLTSATSTPFSGVITDSSSVRKLNNRWGRKFKLVPQVRVKQAKRTEIQNEKESKIKNEFDKEARDVVNDILKMKAVAFDPSPQKPKLKAQQISRKKPFLSIRESGNARGGVPRNTPGRNSMVANAIVTTTPTFAPSAVTPDLISAVAIPSFMMSPSFGSSSSNAMDSISSSSVAGSSFSGSGISGSSVSGKPIRRKLKNNLDGTKSSNKTSETNERKEKEEMEQSFVERMRALEFDDSPVKRPNSALLSPRTPTQTSINGYILKAAEGDVHSEHHPEPQSESKWLNDRTPSKKNIFDDIQAQDPLTPKQRKQHNLNTDPRHERKALQDRVGGTNQEGGNGNVSKRLVFMTPQVSKPKTSYISDSNSETPFTVRIIKKLSQEKERLLKKVQELKQSMKERQATFERERADQHSKYEGLASKYMSNQTEQEELNIRLLEVENGLVDENIRKAELTEEGISLRTEKERGDIERIKALIQMNEFKTKMTQLVEEIERIKEEKGCRIPSHS